MLACCWVSHAAFGGCVSVHHRHGPVTVCGWFVCVVVLCENCIVDASIFIFCGIFFCCKHGITQPFGCVCCVFLCVCCKGARWMPWYAEPMKDVQGCVKPRGVVNEALIRGCPNGETRPFLLVVTLP